MLALSNAEIGGWVASFALPLVRITSFLMTMPIIGTQVLPRRIRLYLALAITLVLAPTLPAMPRLDALDLRMALLVGEQILIGVVMGFSLQLFIQVFLMAGQIISMQMGLGFASMVDPGNGVSVPVLGQLFNILIILLFLIMNGHLVAIEVLAESFVTLPVGGGYSINSLWLVAERLSWALASALLISLPAVAALLLVNITFGIMSRAAPQLNIFAIGFPMTLVLGMVIVWITLADIFMRYQLMITDALMVLRQLAGIAP